jgi:threonine/homoserine/homoserine lactone efflux protein
MPSLLPLPPICSPVNAGYNTPMPLFFFLFGAMMISLSGVMAPGPVTAVTIGKGSDSPYAGAWIAVGHGIVEIPLMILLALGIGRFLTSLWLRSALGIAGGLILIFMAAGLLRGAMRPSAGAGLFTGSPLLAGILLTAGSPFFFVWWATVGAALILQSWAFGLAGFIALCIGHWLCDFFWGYFLSAVSFTGGRFFGRRFQRAVFAVCGLAVLLFGGLFIQKAVVDLF